MNPDSRDDVTQPPASGDATRIQKTAWAPTMPSQPSSPVPATTGTVVAARKETNRLPVGTRLFEFEITGVIGEGGFGIVYTAHDHSLDRNVAIKEYMPSGLASRVDGTTVVVRTEDDVETFDNGRRSFVNEARLLAKFDHPSLLKVFRFWEANGTAYMAMPHYRGETLKQRLKQIGPPTEAWLRALIAPMLDALEVIHQDSCLHRDIAPDNILLVDDDQPVLLDFGAARRVVSDMTQAFTVIVKPGFAPIEQYADVPKLRQGPWTDIYALAATIYYAVMGEKPPPSIGRFVADELKPLSQAAHGRYSAEFLAAIDEGLTVRPEQRPQSAAGFRTLLGKAVGATDAPPGEAAVDLALEPEANKAAQPTSAAPAAADSDRTVQMSSAARPGTAGGASTVVRPRVQFGAREFGLVGGAVVVAIAGALLASHYLSGSQATAVVPAPIQAGVSPQAAPTRATPPNASAQPAGSPQPESAPQASATSPAPPVPATPAPASETSANPAPQQGVVSAQAQTAAPAASISVAPPPRETPAKAPRPDLTRLLAEASASLASSDYARAAGFAHRALAIDPHNAEALHIQQKAQKAAWAEVQSQ